MSITKECAAQREASDAAWLAIEKIAMSAPYSERTQPVLLLVSARRTLYAAVRTMLDSGTCLERAALASALDEIDASVLDGETT